MLSGFVKQAKFNWNKRQLEASRKVRFTLKSTCKFNHVKIHCKIYNIEKKKRKPIGDDKLVNEWKTKKLRQVLKLWKRNNKSIK